MQHIGGQSDAAKADSSVSEKE